MVHRGRILHHIPDNVYTQRRRDKGATGRPLHMNSMYLRLDRQGLKSEVLHHDTIRCTGARMGGGVLREVDRLGRQSHHSKT